MRQADAYQAELRRLREQNEYLLAKIWDIESAKGEACKETDLQVIRQIFGITKQRAALLFEFIHAPNGFLSYDRIDQILHKYGRRKLDSYDRSARRVALCHIRSALNKFQFYIEIVFASGARLGRDAARDIAQMIKDASSPMEDAA